MALKVNEKTIIKKKEQKQKIVVLKGRHPMFGKEIPYELLYSEVVPSVEVAKQREKELREEYKDVEGLSINYFSL